MKKYLIALDDGHGMNTPGKRTPSIPSMGGRVIKENEFNRVVIAKLDRYLNNHDEFSTLLVAPTDSDTSLSARVASANNAGAYIYVSVHANATDGKFDGEAADPSGIETYYNPGSVNGQRLANLVHGYLIQGTSQKNRGVKAKSFYVLKNTDMPAILTENLFMDNEREARLMLDDSYTTEVALEHYKGICDYCGVSHKLNPEKPINDNKPFNNNGVSYRAHIQNVGDQGPMHDGMIMGTVGKSLRLEQFFLDLRKIENQYNIELEINIKAHIQGEGWKLYGNVKHNTPIGTRSESKRLEAVEIEVIGLPSNAVLKYQVHVAGTGWTTVVTNGFATGTIGLEKPIEAMRIWIE